MGRTVITGLGKTGGMLVPCTAPLYSGGSMCVCVLVRVWEGGKVGMYVYIPRDQCTKIFLLPSTIMSCMHETTKFT